MASTNIRGVIPAIEQSPLTRRQKLLVGSAVVSNTVEFFDFFIVGFILTIIATPWHLNFMESSMILLAGGVGSVLGSIIWGRIADKIGRRPCFIWTVLTFSIGTALCAAVPEGNWWLFALLRVVVGFGVGGLPVVDIPLIAEFVPSKQRAMLSGLTVVFIPVGLFLGSLSASALGAPLGWRGLLLLGLIPVLLAFPIRRIVRESPRWLMGQGRMDDARESIAWYRNMNPADVELPPVSDVQVGQKRKRSIFHNNRRALIVATVGSFCFITGSSVVQSWGPTLLTLLLNVTPAQAAQMFLLVSLASLIGRLITAKLADVVGRRPVIIACGFVGAACLLVAAYSGNAVILGASLFFVAILGATLFGDGAFGMLNTFTSEMFKTEDRASGLGLAYGLGSTGKIFGPLLLGLLSGGSNLVSPKATADALPAAFTVFGILLAIGACVYFFARETKGRPMDADDDVHAPAVGAQA
ncbi:MFS transporter [Sinomonas cellulolyticus]|uniref:MFS transporter n=1 Tax=Sinomonas cellulolyticus TaxID=2801916 RepID=A0ABS1JXI1_9MICC|nr:MULTISPECIES: MFS transporter [Sinomonas]MBL0704000.1 MFS transporter [Sinomonas cellulolyticus]GHG59116.1 MFS transporter [Sinomonas sp. KCTC 49339]